MELCFHGELLGGSNVYRMRSFSHSSGSVSGMGTSILKLTSLFGRCSRADFMIRYKGLLGLGEEGVAILQILKDAGL
jgi:hypothetical protein